MGLLWRASRAFFFLRHRAVMRSRYIYISNKQHTSLKGALLGLQQPLKSLRVLRICCCLQEAFSISLTFNCLLWCSYGWTVPLNHVLLIPVEHNPPVHVLPLLQDLSKCSAAELFDPPRCQHGTCFLPSFLRSCSFVPLPCFLSLILYPCLSLPFCYFKTGTSYCLPFSPFLSFLICF